MFAIPRKCFSGEGLTQHANTWTLTIKKRNERAPMQKPHDKGAGAVNGIEHPRQSRAFQEPKLFAEHAMVWELLGDTMPHRLLCGPVRLRDRIVAFTDFVLNIDHGGPEVRQYRFARALTQFDRERKVCVSR